MNLLTKRISSLCFALTLMVFSAVSVYAAETKATANPATAPAAQKATTAQNNSSGLTINNAASVDVGKTVTYTLYLSEASDPIVGFELRLFYDKDLLEYQKGSLDFKKFDNVIYNEDLEGKIPMNHSALDNPPRFSDKGQFVSASFKVLKAGNAEISYFFTELYGEDLTYLKRFKFTYDLDVDGEKVVKDAIPVVNSDESTLQNNQGDFIHYADGMGDENSPKSSDHVQIGTAIVSKVVDVTKNVNGEGKSSGSGFTIIMIVVFAVVVAGVVVGAILATRARNKKEE